MGLQSPHWDQQEAMPIGATHVGGTHEYVAAIPAHSWSRRLAGTTGHVRQRHHQSATTRHWKCIDDRS
ncbi:MULTISPECIES: hypothetical protein [Rhodococcus]|jgi:hypothetical protein|uniref:hypothetical protein n=1 Tax=Rhodococcus TaxID=1827 RepID=UPI00036CD221|nr:MULTISPECIES: hypothetical protein [Rhodococcus]